MPKKAGELKCDDDAPNAAHKPGNHGVGDESNVLTKPEDAEGNLNDAGKYHSCKDEGWVAT